MARRKFSKLKALMYEREITQGDLAPILGRSQTYLALRMNGHQAFDTNDMQKIGETLEIPKTEWLDYFME